MSDRMFVEVKNYNDSADAIIHTDTRTVCVEFASNPEVDINGTVSFDIPEWSLITEESLIEKGHEEAWELAGKICMRHADGGLPPDELVEIFDTRYMNDIFKGNTCSEALAKYNAWKDSKEINVWDEVRRIKTGELGTVIDRSESTGNYHIRFNNRLAWLESNSIEKTGRARTFN